MWRYDLLAGDPPFVAGGVCNPKKRIVLRLARANGRDVDLVFLGGARNGVISKKQLRIDDGPVLLRVLWNVGHTMMVGQNDIPFDQRCGARDE